MSSMIPRNVFDLEEYRNKQHLAYANLPGCALHSRCGNCHVDARKGGVLRCGTDEQLAQRMRDEIG